MNALNATRSFHNRTIYSATCWPILERNRTNALNATRSFHNRAIYRVTCWPTLKKKHTNVVCVTRRFSQKGSLKIHMSKQHSQWEENLIIITPRIDNVIINMLTPILTKSIINTGMRNSFTVLYNAILRDVTALIPCALWDNEAIKSAGTKKSTNALPLFQFARYTLCRLSCVVRRLRYLFCITDGQGNGLQRFRENR